MPEMVRRAGGDKQATGATLASVRLPRRHPCPPCPHTAPRFQAFGEFWDTMAYTDSVLDYNQNAHRQRTIDWCDATGGTCAAFDFTTKGILQEAIAKVEYWRLVDPEGRPPGVVGMWPSR